MAVQYQLSVPTGDTYPAAYARVLSASIDVDAHTLSVRVATYRDKAACDAGNDPVLMSDYTISDPAYTGTFGQTIVTEAALVDAWLLANRPEFIGGSTV